MGYVDLNSSDNQIGAIELKDGTTDNRAEINAANTARTTGTKVVAVQLVNADGTVNTVTLAAAIQALVAGVETNSFLSQPSRRSDAFQATITSADAQAATSVKAKTAAKSIYVTDMVISVGTAMTVQLQDDAGTPVVLMEQVYMPANSVFSKTWHTPLKLDTNVDLDVITSAAGNISVTVTGYVI